jgi:MoxR-like ATPase
LRHVNIWPGPLKLPQPPGGPEQVHVLTENEILAIETALAARRALLVRGEPGTGKTQFAKAAAVALGRAFVPFVVDSRTEARDLLWYFDAVARLAEAQVQGAFRSDSPDHTSVREALAIENFIHPRALWWAFDWEGAKDQAARAHASLPTLPEGCDPANGVVVLIDEVDKAEADVPNGLLEALGAGEFTPQGVTRPVTVQNEDDPPLVVITTNEERSLPDAFVRRCLVLHLKLPDDRQQLVEHLVERGEAHFPDVDSEVLTFAAGMVADDRARARLENRLPLPGQAEFIDLVRAVKNLKEGDAAAQKAVLERIAPFALRKRSEAAT